MKCPLLFGGSVFHSVPLLPERIHRCPYQSDEEISVRAVGASRLVVKFLGGGLFRADPSSYRMQPSYDMLLFECFLDKFMDQVRFRGYRRHRFIMHPCVHSFRQGAYEECVYSVFFLSCSIFLSAEICWDLDAWWAH